MPANHQKKPWEISTETTPESVFLSRRKFLGRGAAAIAGGASLTVLGLYATGQSSSDDLSATLNPHSGNLFIKGQRNSKYKLDRDLTAEETAGRYNNFYEFTTSKPRVWQLAKSLKIRPWTVEIGGEVAKPMTLNVDDIVRKMPIEERTYRFRCVEAWAMAVPWTGFPFRALMNLVQPTSHAKFVRLVTFLRPKEAVGQQPGTPWQWPYYEGLSIEEAGNELTMLANGIYGHELPRQHGAPLRLVVPWKYGYKSIKSIVKIEFTRKRPPTFWNDVAPREYGFWSNVNPAKPHPRWSQATERLIGTQTRVDTMPYNGYGEWVHDLYKGTPNAAL